MHVYQPFTVFTLLDKLQGPDGCMYTGGRVPSFSNHWQGDPASRFVLVREDAEECRESCKANSVMIALFDEILKLYLPDQSSISIPRNRGLNKNVGKMAHLLSPSIAVADQIVSSYIKQQAFGLKVDDEKDKHLKFEMFSNRIKSIKENKKDKLSNA
ncbi:hypothetical protein BGX26_004132 [Mortierella sp. AD094]|nr:hypothetical protein BGX26_004132 [Mortierella sp. AD094]